MAGINFAKSSNVNDSVFGKSQEPIRMMIESRAEAFQQKAVAPVLFNQMNTRNFAEKFSGMTAMNGFLPVGEGGSYPQDEQRVGFEKIIEHDTWKDQFVITKEMIEDRKIGSSGKPRAFVDGYYRTRELFAAKLYIGGVFGTPVVINGRKYNITGNDDRPVFDLAHPSVYGADFPVQGNKFSNAFDVAVLSELESRMQNVVDDKGNVLNIAPDTIVIPNDGALKMAVFAALGADKDPATSNNGFNYQFGRWNIVVSPYLNDLIHTNAGTVYKPWLLIDSHYNRDYGGAIWLDRIHLDVKSWIDDNNDNNVWNGRARFGAGFNDWRFAAVAGVFGGSDLTL